MELTNQKKQFIENIGLFFETQRLPRLAGRIMGLLLISDPPELPAAEIGNMLAMSKGSVSTMTRQLLQFGLIEKVSPFGAHRDFYRVHPDATERILQAKQAEFLRLLALVEKGMDALESEDPSIHLRLVDLHTMCTIVSTSIPELVKQFRGLKKYETYECK